jgi:hypothetical protein
MELVVWLQIFSVLCVAFVYRSAKKRGIEVLPAVADGLLTLLCPVYVVTLIFMVEMFTALQTWLWIGVAATAGGAILTASFVTFVYRSYFDHNLEYRIVKILTLLYVVGSIAMLVKVLVFTEA